MARPELRALVAEASRALAMLDAARLEELALSCAALNRAIDLHGEKLVREAREAVGEMAVLARVLEATRGNIRVMNRLRELRAGRREYGERLALPASWMEGGMRPGGEGSGDGYD